MTTIWILLGLLWAASLVATTGIAYYNGMLQGKAEWEEKTRDAIELADLFHCISKCGKRRTPMKYIKKKLFDIGEKEYEKQQAERDNAEAAASTTTHKESICNECQIEDFCDKRVNGLKKCDDYQKERNHLKQGE